MKNSPKKHNSPALKNTKHPRSKHKGRYNFDRLVHFNPILKCYVTTNKYGDESIDFFNPKAVKCLNKVLLKFHYDIDWDIPENYLCPPIPGRADYIHYMADLLQGSISKKSIKNDTIKCLDIGVGANCIYPIIGNTEYDWQFVGADIDHISIKNAKKIIELNTQLKGKIELRLQPNPKHIFEGIIRENDKFDLTICNPPFHSSFAEAQAGSRRKIKNLKKTIVEKPVLNFAGKSNELWCEGGENWFVKTMINESQKYTKNCKWFSTLISKKHKLKAAYSELKKVNAVEIKTIEMGQGNKKSRVIAWRF